MGLMEVIVGSLCALIVMFVLLQVGRIAYSKITLRWATESLASELKDAKELAKARGQNVSVLFDAKRKHTIEGVVKLAFEYVEGDMDAGDAQPECVDLGPERGSALPA